MKKVLKIFSYIILALCIAWSSYALADECVVRDSGSDSSSSGTLFYYLDKVWEEGSCLVSKYDYRKKYENYINNEGPYHVIRFSKSMDIFVDTIPTLMGKSGHPLIMVADKNMKVRLIGRKKQSIIIRRGNGSVVLDNLIIEGFGSNGVILDSDRNLLINVTVKKCGYEGDSDAGILINGQHNNVVGSIIKENIGDGIQIGKKGVCEYVNENKEQGKYTKIIGTYIGDNGKGKSSDRSGFGIYINADNVLIDGNDDLTKIEKNHLSGVYIESAEMNCSKSAEHKPRQAVVSKTIFNSNGTYLDFDKSLAIAGNPIPSADGVANISDPTEIISTIVGKIKYNKESPFWLINKDELKIDIYKLNGRDEPYFYIGTAEAIDEDTEAFHLTISDQTQTARGKLIGIVLDYDNWQTAEISFNKEAADSILNPTDTDADGDGLSDFDEKNHSTDPFNPDTDGDGLTDGEEVNYMGLVSDILNQGAGLAHPEILDPNNADSDGDCLPDGLELGIVEARFSLLRKNSLNQILNLNPRCNKLLENMSVSELYNAFWINENSYHGLNNVSALFDLDPMSKTDPTVADTDDDGLNDGIEDYNFSGQRDFEETDGKIIFKETDSRLKDSDGDGIIDGDEGDRDENGILDKSESSPIKSDTDDDGIDDNQEVRKGLFPNFCDSDMDGLPDGIEFGVIHPLAEKTECRGLQTTGTNFSNIDVLDPTSKDSDGDGIIDGDEDKNSNGWHDFDETDPTTEDTDSDGINDYIEMTGDLNNDGIADIDYHNINNGSECSPPTSFIDVDCDGILNANDEDSDGDGCLDIEESLNKDKNKNGIPDPYDGKTAICNSASTMSSTGGMSSGMNGNSTKGDSEFANNINNDVTGGGDCSMAGQRSSYNVMSFCLVFFVLGILIFKKMKKNKLC